MAELKPKMKKAVELMVANPEMEYAEVAKEIGIDRVTLWKWRQKPEFQEYSHELCMNRFKEIERIAIQKLYENASNGNQKAIEYALDYFGYKSTTKLEAEVANEVTINIE